MTALATASGCSGNRAWLALSMTVILTRDPSWERQTRHGLRAERAVFGDDLEDRCGAGGPVAAGHSGRTRPGQDTLEQVCPVDQDQPACHPVGRRRLAEDVLEAGPGYLP